MLGAMLIRLSQAHMTNQRSLYCSLFPLCVLYKPRNHQPSEWEHWDRKHEDSEDYGSGLRPVFGTVHHHKRQTNRPHTGLLQGGLVRIRLRAKCRRWNNRWNVERCPTVVLFSPFLGRLVGLPCPQVQTAIVSQIKAMGSYKVSILCREVIGSIVGEFHIFVFSPSLARLRWPAFKPTTRQQLARWSQLTSP